MAEPVIGWMVILYGLGVIGGVVLAIVLSFLAMRRSNVAGNSNEVAELREEVARLRAEVERLKKGQASTDQRASRNNRPGPAIEPLPRRSPSPQT
jgi:cell division protein FtsB